MASKIYRQEVKQYAIQHTTTNYAMHTYIRVRRLDDPLLIKLTFLSRSLHFFLALSELNTEDFRLLLFLSKALMELITEGCCLKTTVAE